MSTNKDKIVQQTQILIDDSNIYKEMSNAINPYGDGKASVRIVEYFKELFLMNKHKIRKLIFKVKVVH